jgi:putative CocE/NonD family hydrolase
MRDGIKLFTVVITPVQNIKLCPILLQRSPYGANIPIPDDSNIPVGKMGNFEPMAKEGYILVFQDIRGKFKSEGTFEMNRPLYHLIDKTRTDESTDAYDAIDWLIKNINNNNGNVGISGVSYPGYRMTALHITVQSGEYYCNMTTSDLLLGLFPIKPLT